MVIPLMMLAIESGGVVTPRMMKLMPCDAETPREVHLMFSEKLDAAFETASSLRSRPNTAPGSISLRASSPSSPAPSFATSG